ncbi:MAG: 4Fe-4S binding protein [Bacteroidales bacterium]
MKPPKENIESISENQFADLIPECCRIGFASIHSYMGLEKEQLLDLLPNTETVVVIAHHIRDSLEWKWFKFTAARGGETCPADIHCLSVAERIERYLDSLDYQSTILSYPGICGPMFKTIAVQSGLGKLGDNFLFMNDTWGPWVHLRVLITDAKIEYSPLNQDSGCTHCGSCIEACPAGAIAPEDFDGIACRDCMREIARTECDGSYLFECERCLRVCPIGIQPREIEVKFKTIINEQHDAPVAGKLRR